MPDVFANFKDVVSPPLHRTFPENLCFWSSSKS